MVIQQLFPTAPPAKIRISDLSVHYAGKPALLNVNMDIPANRCTALIGPSGCGKSTLLRTLNRMNDTIPAARTMGHVALDGAPVLGRTVDRDLLRKRVGMVFQKPNPFPKSIYENVAYGPRVHGIRDRAALGSLVERALRHAALWDEVKDRLKESAMGLSGGQQQRLCIARALAVEPEVVLMDEPTSALDPNATARIESLITELCARYTIVIVTHNMQQAHRISHRAGFLYEGRLVEYGETRQIFNHPREEATSAYVAGRFG